MCFFFFCGCFGLVWFFKVEEGSLKLFYVFQVVFGRLGVSSSTESSMFVMLFHVFVNATSVVGCNRKFHVF